MATDPWINRLFDARYLIQRKLGSGGMAVVYLAEDQELGRRVALKLLDERHAADEQFVERFRREAQNAAGLNHPNIVSIFDRGQAEGTYYIAMEFLDGRTLKELVLRNGPTPIPIAIDYARQILGALAFAHRHGIVHRDIKPHNIVVGRDGRLKVTDFGIARSGSSQMTEAGSIVGTAQYLSPEQARGAQVDPRSDLYSLGIVMYEMLTGKVPFTGDAPVEIAMKHLSSVPEPPSKLRKEVPHALDAVVMRALAKDADERFDSAEEMDADLARVGRGLAVSRRTEEAATQVMSADDTAAATMVQRPRATPPAPPVYRPPGAYYEERPRRSVWPWILGLLALAIASATGYVLYDRIQDQLNQNRPVTVRNVGLEQVKLARQQLEAQGFQVRVVQVASDTVAIGAVISQDPAGGEPRPKGSMVTLTVSTGKPKSTVPEVRGLTLTDAIAALYDAGLGTNAHEVFSSQPSGTVTGQFPPAGEIVLSGTKVRINVSQGERTAGVPNVVGEQYANAASALQGPGFKVARIDADSDEPKGQVIAQSPIAGSTATQGSTVTVTVSKGPVTADIPDVTRDTLTDAQQILEEAGFKSTVVPEDVTDPSQDGLVLSQDPPSGPAEKGTTVTLIVGQLVSTPPDEFPTDTTTHDHDDHDADDNRANRAVAPLSRRVAVLSGGRSSEHEVSVASARSVAEALAGLGVEVVAIEIDRDGRWSLEGAPPDGAVQLPGTSVGAALVGVDVVFPVLHGPFGEDGTVQGLLELAGVAYVGAGVAASALCMDKDMFKAVLRDRGIPVPRNLTLRPGDEAQTPYGYPVFVKPARLGSSVGISKAHDHMELAAAVALAFEHDEKVLVEEFVEGTEVEVGVLGNRDPIASLPGEIVVTSNEWYDYEAKYAEGAMELVVPARIGEHAARRAQELAVDAFVAAECEGMARVDLFVRDDGKVLVNELNTIPGFTETSVYAKLFEATGIPYASLLERLIDLALERHERRRSLRY